MWDFVKWVCIILLVLLLGAAGLGAYLFHEWDGMLERVQENTKVLEKKNDETDQAWEAKAPRQPGFSMDGLHVSVPLLSSNRTLVFENTDLCVGEAYWDANGSVLNQGGAHPICKDGHCTLTLPYDNMPLRSKLILYRKVGDQCVREVVTDVLKHIQMQAYKASVSVRRQSLKDWQLDESMKTNAIRTPKSLFTSISASSSTYGTTFELQYSGPKPTHDEFKLGEKLVRVDYTESDRKTVLTGYVSRIFKREGKYISGQMVFLPPYLVKECLHLVPDACKKIDDDYYYGRRKAPAGSEKNDVKRLTKSWFDLQHALDTDGLRANLPATVKAWAKTGEDYAPSDFPIEPDKAVRAQVILYDRGGDPEIIVEDFLKPVAK